MCDEEVCPKECCGPLINFLGKGNNTHLLIQDNKENCSEVIFSACISVCMCGKKLALFEFLEFCMLPCDKRN